MAKFYEIDPGLFVFDCPGCGYGHHVRTFGDGPNWTFNNDLEKPTVSPSLLVCASYPKQRCHSFVKDGKIQFLNDCFHELAGQTVELPEHDWG
ncbi:MAG: DUF6527 family protein [Sneathiella sp.]